MSVEFWCEGCGANVFASIIDEKPGHQFCACCFWLHDGYKDCNLMEALRHASPQTHMVSRLADREAVRAEYAVSSRSRRQKMNYINAFTLRDTDLKGEILDFIVKGLPQAIDPSLRERFSDSTLRRNIMRSLDSLFNAANEKMPEDIKQGFGKEGEGFLSSPAGKAIIDSLKHE